MAQSQVEICNRALSRIGHQQRIAAITDNTAPARACLTWYDQIRQSMLRDRPWPFAQRYVALGRIVADPNPDWGYAYRYPTDFLKIYRVYSTTGTTSGTTIYATLGLVVSVPSFAQVPPWQIGSDTQGRIIYTDLADANAGGTWDVDDEGIWDPLFAEAFAWRLAYEIAPGLAKDNAIMSRCRGEYDRLVQEASASALNEGARRPDSEDSFTASRH